MTQSKPKKVILENDPSYKWKKDWSNKDWSNKDWKDYKNNDKKQ